MIEAKTFLVIVLMMCATYFTRVAGFLFLKDRELSPKAKKVLEATPGCVLISVIAPSFATGRPADAIALLITVVSAIRLGLLPTILISVISAAVLRRFL